MVNLAHSRTFYLPDTRSPQQRVDGTRKTKAEQPPDDMLGRVPYDQRGRMVWKGRTTDFGKFRLPRFLEHGEQIDADAYGTDSIRALGTSSLFRSANVGGAWSRSKAQKQQEPLGAGSRITYLGERHAARTNFGVHSPGPGRHAMRTSAALLSFCRLLTSHTVAGTTGRTRKAYRGRAPRAPRRPPSRWDSTCARCLIASGTAGTLSPLQLPLLRRCASSAARGHRRSGASPAACPGGAARPARRRSSSRGRARTTCPRPLACSRCADSRRVACAVADLVTD